MTGAFFAGPFFTSSVPGAGSVATDSATLSSVWPSVRRNMFRTSRTWSFSVATFHFDFEAGGDVRFEKVCDGRIWRELHGAVTLVERKDKTRVRIELEGRTKALVPEFTIRGPMQDQLEQMAKALKRRLGAKA